MATSEFAPTIGPGSTADPTDSLPRGWVRVVVGALLTLHAVLVLIPSLRYGPRIDEAGHLASGVAHWQTGDLGFYVVNPPLVRMVATAPVAAVGWEVDLGPPSVHRGDRPEFGLGRLFAKRYGQASFDAWRLARLTLLPVTLLGGWVAYRWSAQIGGHAAGLATLALWSVSPNLLATASSICPDLSAAVAGLVCLRLFARWLDDPAWPRAAALGLAAGIAMLTKFTWIALAVLFPACWLFDRLFDRVVRRRPAAAWRRQAVQIAAISGLVWSVVVVGYGAERMFRPLGEFQFRSEFLRSDVVRRAIGQQSNPTPKPSRPERLRRSGNCFAGSPLANVPCPLPARLVEGIDIQKRDFESGFDSYLLGEWKSGGWKSYYLIGLACKVPVALWGLILLAVGPATRRLGRADALSLLAIPVGLFVLVSLQDGFSHHLRYVLFVFPPLFVLAGQAVSPRPNAPAGASITRSPRRLLGLVLLVAFAAESLSQFPHVQAFFTYAVGGPDNSMNLLVDSNVDWGQDITTLQQWMADHPEVDQLQLAYFGLLNPADVGISYRPPILAPPHGSEAAAQFRPEPGWYAASVTLLAGYEYGMPTPDGGMVFVPRGSLRYLRCQRPVERLGNSIYIYRLTETDADSWSEAADPSSRQD